MPKYFCIDEWRIKMMLVIQTGVMYFSVAVCGNQKPDLEEVEKAIVNGGLGRYTGYSGQ